MYEEPSRRAAAGCEAAPASVATPGAPELPRHGREAAPGAREAQPSPHGHAWRDAAGKASPREDAGGGLGWGELSWGLVIFGEGGCVDDAGLLSILRGSVAVNIPLPDLADRETEAQPLSPTASSPQHPHPCWPGDASCPDLFVTLPSCSVN